MAEGEFALVTERLENALALPGQPVKRGTMAHEHIMYMMLVDTAAAAGDLATLDRYVPLLEELAERDGHRPYLAVARRTRGVARFLRGSLEEAETSLNEAAGIFHAAGLHWQLGRTLTERGRVAAARGASKEAEEYFHQAMDLFEQLGAKPAFQAAREAMNNHLP